MEAVVLSIATGGFVSYFDHAAVLHVGAGIVLVPPEVEESSRSLEQVTAEYGIRGWAADCAGPYE
jgi:hypothetical protein